jgi:poly(3-hydroxybutyrate) depolymerase
MAASPPVRARRLHPLMILLLLLQAGLAWSDTSPSDFLVENFVATGSLTQNLPYRLLVPPGYSASTRYPLILFMHGAGEAGTDNMVQLTAGGNTANGAMELVSAANLATYPCFMLAPQSPSGSGWSNASQDSIIAIISLLEANYSIDTDRIYCTGLSMGGFGTYAIVTRYPSEFACAVPMSGGGAGSYGSIAGIPFWTFHAANDPTVAISNDDTTITAFRAAGGRSIYTRYATGGHGIWPVAYQTPALLPWMMAQRRNQPVTGTPILAITTPAASAVSISGASLPLSGSCSFLPGDTIAQVQWTTDLATFTAATGTSAWSIAAAAVPAGLSRVSVIATGPSYSAADGGSTTVSDSVSVSSGSAVTTPPTVSIATPAANGGSVAVTTATVNVSGTAADASGIQQVSWSDNLGGSGIAQGTTSWSISSIDVAAGANLITVTARNGANLTTSASITVTGPAGPGGAASSGSSDHHCGLGNGFSALVLGLAVWLALVLRASRRRI